MGLSDVGQARRRAWCGLVAQARPRAGMAQIAWGGVGWGGEAQELDWDKVAEVEGCCVQGGAAAPRDVCCSNGARAGRTRGS